MAQRPSRKKRILVALFVLLNVLTIAVTATIEFSGSKPNYINFTGLKLYLLAVAVLLFGCVVLAESAKYALMLRVTTKKRQPAMGFKVAVLGKYFDNVTPLGAGGQPFQISFLHKQGIPFGIASSLPIAGFLMNQFAFIVLIVTGFILNSFLHFVTSPVLIVSASIGIAFYAAIPLMLVLFTVMPKFSKSVIVFFIRIGHKLHLVKDLDATVARSVKSLEAYRASLVALSKTKHLLLFVFLLSLLFQICLCSIPYFILTAFGSGTGFIEIFFMCVYTYSAVTFVPTPGNAGAAEGTFYALFKTLDTGYIFWAMIIWRFLTYYSFIFLGAGLHIFNFLKNKRALKHREES